MNQKLSFEDRLYNRQAERITELNEEVRHLKKRIDSLNVGAHFYMALIEAIGDDVMLQDEWRRFISVLRLSHPNIPGITTAESVF